MSKDRIDILENQKRYFVSGLIEKSGLAKLLFNKPPSSDATEYLELLGIKITTNETINGKLKKVHCRIAQDGKTIIENELIQIMEK